MATTQDNPAVSASVFSAEEQHDRENAKRLAQRYRVPFVDLREQRVLTDREAIRTAVAALRAPLNILATPRTPPVAALASLGVKRLSLGSGPVRAALGCLRAIAREILEQGTYRFLDDAVPYDEANRL